MKVFCIISQNACNISKVCQYRLGVYLTSNLRCLTSGHCIYDEFKKVGQFSLQLSNGKERVAAQAKTRTMLGEHNDTNCSRFYSDEGKSLERWRKPTFADCTAFGETAKRILSEYKPKDEIWLIARYYSKQQGGKYYKGFIVREIITEKEIQQANESVFDDLPF